MKKEFFFFFFLSLLVFLTGFSHLQKPVFAQTCLVFQDDFEEGLVHDSHRWEYCPSSDWVPPGTLPGKLEWESSVYSSPTHSLKHITPNAGITHSVASCLNLNQLFSNNSWILRFKFNPGSLDNINNCRWFIWHLVRYEDDIAYDAEIRWVRTNNNSGHWEYGTGASPGNYIQLPNSDYSLTPNTFIDVELRADLDTNKWIYLKMGAKVFDLSDYDIEVYTYDSWDHTLIALESYPDSQTQTHFFIDDVELLNPVCDTDFTIQGYKIDCPGGTKAVLDETKEDVDNPYFFRNISPGTHTVSLELPESSLPYDIFYSPCDCCINHPDNSFISGSQHDFTKYTACGGDYNYYDLYWKCTSPYDLNQDGQVNVQDIKIFLENWGSFPSLSEVDFNSDSIVNALDFGMMVKLML